MDAHFTAFLGVSVLVIIVPGPDMALVMRNALFGGRRCGICTGLGSATGLVVWTLATSAGLAALLIASRPLFVALKLAGAAYLVYLGVQALWGALRSGGHERTGTGLLGGGKRLAPLVAYRQGVVSNLGNPKIAVFFTSLLPQFLPAGDAAFGGLLLLGLSFCSLTLLWLTVYAAAVAKAGDVLRRPSIRRAMEGLTGAVLIGLGLRLAAERR